MPKPLPLLHHLWIELAALGLAAAGFWLYPDDPALPALALTAAALPLALLFACAFLILDRREAAKAKAARNRDSIHCRQAGTAAAGSCSQAVTCPAATRS